MTKKTPPLDLTRSRKFSVVSADGEEVGDVKQPGSRGVEVRLKPEFDGHGKSKYLFHADWFVSMGNKQVRLRFTADELKEELKGLHLV